LSDQCLGFHPFCVIICRCDEVSKSAGSKRKLADEIDSPLGEGPRTRYRLKWERRLVEKRGVLLTGGTFLSELLGRMIHLLPPVSLGQSPVSQRPPSGVTAGTPIMKLLENIGHLLLMHDPEIRAREGPAV
jgi:hypothetical protein